MYIDDKLSKEENLENARKIQEKAQDLFNKFKILIHDALSLTPAQGFSKRERDKNAEPNKILIRLSRLLYAVSDVENIYKSKEKAQKEKDDKIKQEKNNIEKIKQEQEYLNKAIKYCLDHGKIFGKDFNAESAISLALDIAFEEQLAVMLKENKYFDFDGNNCENCMGWNGIDRRCECGNRRVSWVVEGRFDDLIVYAEAW